MQKRRASFPRHQKRGLIEANFPEWFAPVAKDAFRAIKSAVSLKLGDTAGCTEVQWTFRAIKSAVSLKHLWDFSPLRKGASFRAIKSAVSLKLFIGEN